jgi:DNA-directed RNA polymerase specialized sigma24 family protein
MLHTTLEKNTTNLGRGLDHALDHALNLDHATEALDTLDAELRQSIHHTYYSGFSTNQVADLLGVSVETIDARLCDGLTNLREALASAA